MHRLNVSPGGNQSEREEMIMINMRNKKTKRVFAAVVIVVLVLSMVVPVVLSAIL